MFYALLGTMLLAAVLVIALPLYKKEQRLSAKSMSAIVMVLLISIFVYSRIGTPDAGTPQPDAMPGVEEMVNSLARRLQQNPDDLLGWKMLGRSYLQIRNFPGAITAFERAVEIEAGRNGQTLADLGEVILMSDHRRPSDRASQLFENALAIATRCCSPPESCVGSRSALVARPTSLSTCGTWFRITCRGRPITSRANATFS